MNGVSRGGGSCAGGWLRWSWIVVCLWVFPLVAVAHDLGYTEVFATFSQEGTYEVNVLLDVPRDLLDSPERIRPYSKVALETVRDQVELRFDGTAVFPGLSLPQFDPGAEMQPGRVVIVRMRGATPPEASRFEWASERIFGPVVLSLRSAGALDGDVVFVDPGYPSRPYAFERPPEPPSLPFTIVRYVELGFTHILPKGVDHVLFVLGLFLLTQKRRPLLIQVSAFTLAHTVTLALSTLGWVSLPARVVEPIIALSIAWIALENLWMRELKPWRPLLVFCFGLLHGLGFAGVLSELGLPSGQVVPALLSFNVGVELGQLAVLVVAYMALSGLDERPWYRARVVIPGSLVIAAVGVFWTVQRVVG